MRLQCAGATRGPLTRSTARMWPWTWGGTRRLCGTLPKFAPSFSTPFPHPRALGASERPFQNGQASPPLLRAEGDDEEAQVGLQATEDGGAPVAEAVVFPFPPDEALVFDVTTWHNLTLPLPQESNNSPVSCTRQGSAAVGHGERPRQDVLAAGGGVGYWGGMVLLHKYWGCCRQLQGTWTCHSGQGKRAPRG